MQQHVGPKLRRPPSGLGTEEARTVALYAKALPTVVTIYTSQKLKGSPRRLGLGTGVLISSDCHILTAAHVVRGADSIIVKTQDGKKRKADVLFSERGADIALLRLQTPDRALPHAELGDSDRLAVGQRLYIIGNPRGLENSLSTGHLSGFREFGKLYDASILVEFIQTDAAINSGNSGGPVFDSSGRVIGIASRIITHSGGSEGLGFIIAINTAKQLLALQNRAWTGMEGRFLSRDQLAELLNLDQPGGLLVQRVAKNSPAARAGIRGGSIEAIIKGKRLLLGGDLILQFGDQEACHSECLAAVHDKLTKLDHIRVKYLRAGQLQETTINISSTRKNYLNPNRVKR